MDIGEFDAVEVLTINGVKVVLVGEHHESEDSIIPSIISNISDISVIGVELCSRRFVHNSEMTDTTHNNPGFKDAISYACDTETPLSLIDIPGDITQARIDMYFSENPNSYDDIDKLNEDVSEESGGDVNMDEIRNYLQTLQDKHPEAYDIVHGDRDPIIARHIELLIDYYGSTVLIVVGAAHLPVLADALRNDKSENSPYSIPVFHSDHHGLRDVTSRND